MKTSTTFLICILSLFFVQCENDTETWHSESEFPEGNTFFEPVHLQGQGEANLIGDWSDAAGNVSVIGGTTIHIVSENVSFEYEITPTTEFSYPMEQYDDPKYEEFIGVYQIRDKDLFIEFRFITATHFILVYNETQEVELTKL